VRTSKPTVISTISPEEIYMSDEIKEETESRHRKELKSLDGQKRAALKKAKQTGGKSKKAKEVMSTLEEEFDSKEKEMKARHETELNILVTTQPEADNIAPKKEESSGSSNTTASIPQQPKKLSKSQKKRLKQKEKEKQREIEIEEELKNAGPTAREIELTRIYELYLDPLNLCIKEIEADGNCLYRAVGNSIELDYPRVRAICSDTLKQNASTFEPFCESDNYIDYCFKVRYSSDWGGELELRALAIGLKRKIIVYSADGAPIIMSGDDDNEAEEENNNDILLSYHRSYYALGEHYNVVTFKA